MLELEKLREGLQNVADLLYQERTVDAYNKLFPLLPEIENMAVSINDKAFHEEIEKKLKIALEAMEANDSLLLADIIQYELLESLSNL